MADWLVIALRGPLASFAESPGNAVRKTGDMPARSALIGLAGAALGVLREDAEGQRALAASLVTAAAVLRPGALLSDFHTFQSLNQSAKGARTRAVALARKEHLETAITRREYRADGLWQAAYRLADLNGALKLEALAGAFQRPRLVLSIGRRACPPSLPLNPLVFAAEDVRDAFAAHAETMNELKGAGRHIVCLEDRRDVNDTRLVEHRRRDDPRDRSIRWTFADRTEWLVPGEKVAGQGVLP